MGIRSRSVLGRYGRTIVVILLTPITTLNASQALTLCVGHDGHVALELLVQDRCTCEIRDAAGDAMAGSPRVMEDSGLPCMDIPIPGGSCDNRMRSDPAPVHRRQRQLAVCGVTDLLQRSFAYVNPTVHKPGGPDDATQSLLAFVSHYTPLDSILLHV